MIPSKEDTIFKCLQRSFGPTLNLSKYFGALLGLKPLIISVDKTTPLTYNITIIKKRFD
jgi:hypothetical protein